MVTTSFVVSLLPLILQVKMPTLLIYNFIEVLYHCGIFDRLNGGSEFGTLPLLLLSGEDWRASLFIYQFPTICRMRSIINHLKQSRDFPRLRIGIPLVSPFLFCCTVWNIPVMIFCRHWATTWEDGSSKFCSPAFYQERARRGFHYDTYLRDILVQPI